MGVDASGSEPVEGSETMRTSRERMRSPNVHGFREGPSYEAFLVPAKESPALTLLRLATQQINTRGPLLR